MESLMSGTLAGTGSFRCEECGYVVTLAAEDELPDCPGCGGARFVRASLFAGGRFSAGKASDAVAGGARGRPGRRRASASRRPGQYLAYDDGGDVQIVALDARVDAHRAAASPPTCASTTRPSRAATR